jgi:transcriptional regulator
VYTPAPFQLDEAETWSLLAASRLGVLVTAGPNGPEATHLPFVVDAERRTLTGHLARANPHLLTDGAEALVIFSGPDAYITPSWYASKAEHGRVVPTWDYEAVHVRGRLRPFDDRARLLDVVERLTSRFEAGRAEPWAVSDAPPAYIDRLLAAIVGLELTVTAVEAKRKASQTKSAADRAGVHAGLSAGAPSEQAMARLMS